MVDTLIPPPVSEPELLRRAHALCGLTAGELAARIGIFLPSDPVRAKGKVGELVERALGATAGSQDMPDFPRLGVELKTIPMDELGRVRESTHVCAIDLDRADEEEWEDSRVHRKLQRVLWFPVQAAPGENPAVRLLGRALIWSPTAEQQAVLRRDWESLTGALAVGGMDEISAHQGEALQIRPKAANAAARVEVLTPAGDLVSAMPCGFYLRARFTAQILWHLAAE